jgi:phosphomannomutase
VALILSDAAADELAALAGVLMEIKPPVHAWLIFHVGAHSTAERWLRLAREQLSGYNPAALFGGGANANFTELNRARPSLDPLDLLCYSINPQVHAFDNASLAETLAAQVVSRGCQLGVAFDGDGDRAIFVDHAGRVVDGDAVLLMCGAQLQREGRLKGHAVVATVMSNIGLELALRALGIELVRTAVGDKYVMEEMLKRDLSLGGEQSGHIIFSDYLFTGDGLCTALNVLRTVALSGRSLADLASDLTTYPQVLLNVSVREKVPLHTVPAVAAAIARVEKCVAGHGRLLVRYSGTEPLLRVMLEGKHQDEIRRWAQEIVDVVREHLG